MAAEASRSQRTGGPATPRHADTGSSSVRYDVSASDDPSAVPASPEPSGADDSGTRWLDVEEQRAWRSYLRAVRLLDEEMRRGLERHGLSHPEYEILVRLSESPERKARMSELASSVVSSRSRLTHTVARLQQAGLVDRRASPDDRRGVECVLTDEGFAALEAAAHTHVEDVRSLLLDAMTREEFLALGRSLAKVADRIDPQGLAQI